MKTVIVIALAAAAVLAGCSSKETKVSTAPAPAPAPSTVVVTPPTVAAAPTQGQVIVTYMRGTTTQAMAQTATSYCAQHFGSTGARFLGDDYAGHATYACM
jgi:putative hemolysin